MNGKAWGQNGSVWVWGGLLHKGDGILPRPHWEAGEARATEEAAKGIPAQKLHHLRGGGDIIYSKIKGLRMSPVCSIYAACLRLSLIHSWKQFTIFILCSIINHAKHLSSALGVISPQRSQVLPSPPNALCWLIFNVPTPLHIQRFYSDPVQMTCTHVNELIQFSYFSFISCISNFIMSF